MIVTPAAKAAANNGNYRTASRWAQMLAGDNRVIVAEGWDGAPVDVLLALHARRSHEAIRAFRSAHPTRPILLALTGTDLYKDIPANDADAHESLALADHLITLQADAVHHLPAAFRHKVTLIFQSARGLVPARLGERRIDFVFVGHLRDEKDPRTLFAAQARLAPVLSTRLKILGAPLDATLAAEAYQLAAKDPRVRYLGPEAHTRTRQHIRFAHALVMCSKMEGGANVVVEAITAGTAVLASRMSGNVGMLGADYPGYFEVGDAAGLADLMRRFARDPAFRRHVREAALARSPLFTPERERAAICALVAKVQP